MLFNSYEFILVFLPITLIVFFALCRYKLTKLATASLVLASLAFYSYWDVRYLPLLVCSIIFNYTVGSAIERNRSKKLLWLGVGVNLLFLGYFKYTGFFLKSLYAVFPLSFSIPDIVLPLGISFFTFTQTAYLVDAYRGETKHYSFLTYSLFVTIFPHLIAGPILYHKNMIPQFTKLRTFVFSHKNMALGIAMFSMGLFKKVIIADTLAPFVKVIFDNADKLTFFEAWGGALAYTFQLYFDFSGYSEMAIGLGLMFNLHLPVNFNSPYKATSIIDFWRRWHMTLSAFLKNYLYIPLGGNRHGEYHRFRNLMITMLLGGLWHGAGWTFVIWGGLHGIYLVINHAWRKLNINMPRFAAWTITFIAVVVAWVFFRASSAGDAYAILKTMAGAKGIVLSQGLAGYFALLKPLGVKFGFLANLPNEIQLLMLVLAFVAATRFKNPVQLTSGFKPSYLWAAVIIIISVISLINLNQVSEFLYFQF